MGKRKFRLQENDQANAESPIQMLENLFYKNKNPSYDT